MTNSVEEKLRNYLNLFWLRPENGLLCTFKSEAFRDIKFESPSLDISCGDGLFMFIHNGGILDIDFDYFQFTNAKKFSHSSFVDIFDYYNNQYEVKIKKQVTSMIDYGTDWKQALLDKAAKLNLYKKLIVHDNNVTPVPFPEKYFQTIYSNSLYWVSNVENLIRDIHRMLKDDGTAILEVATPYFYNYLEHLEQYLSPKAISILDRNRRATSPGTRTYVQWKNLIEEHNFVIEEVKIVYPNKMLVKLWNIGLRPIAHLLVQMSGSLDSSDRSKIKSEWVDIFYELFKPLLYLDQNYTLTEAPYLMFKIKKKL